MSHQKLFKVIQDSPLGYQTLNQLHDNLADIRTQMRVEHGGSEVWFHARGTIAPPPEDRLGHHSMVEVPKSVAQSYLIPNFNALTLTPAWLWNGQGISSIWKVSVGQYLLSVRGYSRFWGFVTPLAGSSLTYFANSRPFYPSSANGSNSGIWLYLYSLVGGDLVEVDSSFAVTLHGQ